MSGEGEGGLRGPRGVRIPSVQCYDFEIPHPIVARLALEILWNQFVTTVPGELEPEEQAVNKALHDMHEMLWRREMEAVNHTALTAHYLIIRPVNPMNMPGPDETAAIAAAIATLDSHSLIARPWADDD
jgi:hypothetical protein